MTVTNRPTKRSRPSRNGDAPRPRASRVDDWDIVGNTHVVERLRRLAVSELNAHAFLLTGPRGIGKTSVALAFVHTALCTDTQQRAACGDCQNCAAWARTQHPDFTALTEGETVGIEDIRTLTATLARRPTLADRHFVIIDKIERMTEEAANAFLKSLEEPRGRTVFILTSDATHTILPTIVSRCAVLPMTMTGERAIRERLIANGVPDVQAASIAAFSDGRPAYALFLASQPAAYERAQEDADTLLNLIRVPYYERIRLAESLATHHDEPHKLLNLVERWESLVRRMLTTAAQGSTVSAPSPSTRTTLPMSDIARIAHHLSSLRSRIAHHVNSRLSLESFALHLPHLNV